MEVEWDIFVKASLKAFHNGDVAFFIILEKIRHLIIGFSNLNDLGQVFTKFGLGFSKWNELENEVQQIQDNLIAKQKFIDNICEFQDSTLSSENNECWLVFVECFTNAFDKRDTCTLTVLRSIGIRGFDGLAKIGPLFEKYGPGFECWDDMCEELWL